MPAKGKPLPLLPHDDRPDRAALAEPVAFPMFPPASAFEDARTYLETLARAFDEIAYQIAREANDHAPNKITARQSIFSDALHDSDLPGELTEAAETMRDDAEAA